MIYTGYFDQVEEYKIEKKKQMDKNEIKLYASDDEARKNKANLKHKKQVSSK